jgi:hypothetical protein
MRLGGDRFGDAQDRLTRARAALDLHTVVHFQHERVEMHPALLLDRRRREKQIHQHRFAAPDRPPQIKPLRRGLRITEQPAEPAARGRRVITQFAVKPLEPLGRTRLRRIGADRPGRASRAV